MIRTLLPAPALAAGLALLLEYSGLTWREALPTATVGLLAALLAGFALLFAGALLIDGVLALTARIGPLGALGRRLATGRLGWPIFALALLGGLAAWTADLVLYVRLYPGYHAALGLTALGAFTVAMRVAICRQMASAGAAPERPGARRWAVLIGAFIMSLAAAHLTLHTREDGKAAILGHGVIAADLAWLGDAASDLDRDDAGWLFSAADPAPFDGARATPGCLDAPPPAASATWAPGPPQRPLNLLLITVDALRRDHSASDPRGHGARHMPALAKLAERSLVFTEAYAPAAMTLPSIAALHTGRYPWALAWAPTVVAADETVRHPLDAGAAASPWPRAWPGDARVGTPALDRHPTLAAGLTAAGYATAGWPPHESFLGPFGLGRGFATYPPDIVRALNPNGVAVTGHAVADRAARFIVEHARGGDGQPFFAWAHLFDPHHPYRWPPGTDTTADTDLARYRAEVLYTDLQVARLLTLLRQTGLEESTVVVFTADHGEAFGERGAGYHSTGLFDELVTVPLIIRAPGQAPAVVADPVSLVDVAPTVAGVLGLDPAPTWQGRDLLGSEAPGPVLSEVAYDDLHRQYLLRQGDWTLIWDWDRGYRQLFDVAADPGQLDNRIVDASERAEAMTAALCAALRETAGLQTAPAQPGAPVPLLGR